MKRISNFKFQISNSGFTLIELLISIFIVTILIGAVFASYASLNQRQTLISSGQTLKNILRDAQNRAVTNEIDCNFCDCSLTGSTSFNGWTVDFVNEQIYGSCGPTPTIFSARPFNLSGDIIITPYVTPPQALIFGNNPPSTNGPGTICLSHSNLGSNTFYVIRINGTGAISDEGGLKNTCP